MSFIFALSLMSLAPYTLTAELNSDVNASEEELEFVDELDQDAIDAGLDDLGEVEAPSNFMIFVRRIFSPVAVACFNMYGGISQRLRNLKERIVGKDLCCRCYNHYYRRNNG